MLIMMSLLMILKHDDLQIHLLLDITNPMNPMVHILKIEELYQDRGLISAVHRDAG
jgi:hypothetical protein